MKHEQAYDERLRQASIDANDTRARAGVKPISELDVDPAALTKRSSIAPPMKSTHVEVRRRVYERARDAVGQAQDDLAKARASYEELIGWPIDDTAPKMDERSEALAALANEMPTNTKSEWNVGTAALDTQVGGTHYKKMAIQPVEFIDKNQIPYLEGNAIKYICRHAEKGGVQDIDKAIHYLQLLKEIRYGTSE